MTVAHEQAVLGGLMLDNTAWDAVADRITADDFYRRDHQLIFAAIAELAALGIEPDPLAVAERLDARDSLDAAGGLSYIAHLARETAVPAHAPLYAERIREFARIRRIRAAAAAITMADDIDAAVKTLLEVAA